MENSPFTLLMSKYTQMYRNYGSVSFPRRNLSVEITNKFQNTTWSINVVLHLVQHLAEQLHGTLVMDSEICTIKADRTASRTDSYWLGHAEIPVQSF